MQNITSGEITVATRDVEMNGLQVQVGQYIGLLDGDLVVADSTLATVLRDLLEQAVTDDSELITLYYGESLDEPQARALVDALMDQFEDQDLELVRGGQPLYPFIISVE